MTFRDGRGNRVARPLSFLSVQAMRSHELRRKRCVTEMVRVIMDVIRNRIDIPALNKWLSVFPNASCTFLAISLHDLVPRAARRVLGEDAEPDVETSEQQDRARLGVSQKLKSESMVRQENRRRQRKMCNWLSAPDTRMILAVWCSLAEPLMSIHYDLFAHGSVSVGKKKEKESPGEGSQASVQTNAAQPKAQKGKCMFRYMSSRRSPALAILADFSVAITDTNSEEHMKIFRGLISLYGGVHLWPPDLLSMVTTCTLLLCGGLWRRFWLRVCATTPGSLTDVVDPALPEEARMERARAFVHSKRCCLDEYFGLPFSEMLTDPEDLFLEPLQKFLRELFFNGVAASTHSENAFAHCQRICAKAWKPLHVATLAAEHVVLETRRVHGESSSSTSASAASAACTASAASAAAAPASPGASRRPVWRKTRRKRNLQKVSSSNMHMKHRYNVEAVRHPRKPLEPPLVYRNRILAIMHSKWRAMPPKRRQLYQGRASAEKSSLMLQGDPLQQYVDTVEHRGAVQEDRAPWGLCDSDFPVAVAVVDRDVSEWCGQGSWMKGSAELWRNAHGDPMPVQETIPRALQIHTPCPEIASRCMHDISGPSLEVLQRILRFLQHRVAPRGECTLGRGIALRLQRQHARTHARTHTRTHTHTHARTHAYTHTHTHTHTHTAQARRRGRLCGDELLAPQEPHVLRRISSASS